MLFRQDGNPGEHDGKPTFRRGEVNHVPLSKGSETLEKPELWPAGTVVCTLYLINDHSLQLERTQNLRADENSAA